MPTRRMNSLGIYWLRYTNGKAVKHVTGLSRSGSYSAVINPNV